jgi:2-polyprenyl-6-methoxyphenol hydroxylase-like FAD-dependent oxidoreductase
LQGRAQSVGVDLHFETVIATVDDLKDYDLIVAADGLNSLIRRSFEGDFKTSIYYIDNKFAWFGTSRRFETLSQTFVQTDQGYFNAHHYRYSPTMSTFIVECDRPTWQNYGFAEMTIEESIAVCERIFADTLQGHPLISNKSTWRSFPWLWNDRWSFKNMVLVGDALHTAHYSIGSGTRLAMEDVIALARALEARPSDMSAGLKLYEAERRPVVEKLVAAAKASADWYEDFAKHMQLSPTDFAMGYITRSGRVDVGRLKQMSPKFMALYQSEKESPKRSAG